MLLDEDKGELAGTRVLVVDDQEDVRETLEAFFAMFGMDVISAASGNQAFAVFTRSRPQVVVSDIWMPDGSGLDLVRRIRKLAPDEGGLTPAISVSGGAKSDESLAAGFHYHFVKPVDPVRLLDAVRDFVSSGGGGCAHFDVDARGRDLVLRFAGHVTAGDVRSAIAALLTLLARSDGARVITDLRELTGFDPSVGAVVQTRLWQVRHQIESLLVVGGSPLAQAVARSSCLILGIACHFADTLPDA